MSDVDFELIAESIPQIVWMAAPNGAMEYLNQRGTQYTGMPREANIGWGWLQLIHTDDRDRAERSWREAVEREAPYAIEYRLRRDDGEHRWNECRAMPVRDAGGRVIKWIGTVADIEERRRLEERLRKAERETAESLALLETLLATAPVGFGFVDRGFPQIRGADVVPIGRPPAMPIEHALRSEERYQHLFEQAYDAIFNADLEGNFISINPAAERLIGYTSEEATRLGFFDLIVPEDADTSGRDSRGETRRWPRRSPRRARARLQGRPPCCGRGLGSNSRRERCSCLPAGDRP